MIFHHSILSIFRSKGKTALFTLLIFALTLALSLGVSVWASVVQFLEECNDFYTTIGLVEYMGTNYPDDIDYDPAMDEALKSFDQNVIADDEASLSWDDSTRSLGYVDGFWRTDKTVPDRMLSVLVVGNVYFEEEINLYSGIVMKTLYSLKSEEDTVILIDADFGTFEKGHYYLVFGEIYYGSSPLLHLRAATFDNAIAKAMGVEVPRMIDITSDGKDNQYYEIPDDSPLVQVAETLPVTNNSVLVTATDDLMSLFPFHQEELFFVEGRTFSEEEYAQGSHVCVISELMTSRLGIGVGDTIDLSVAVSDESGVYNSYWVEDGFSYNDTFEVVGITNTVADKSWYVFVPKSAGVPPSQFPIGYTVGQAILRNDDAADFYARMQPLMSDRFQLTIYDQGYSDVAIPFKTILAVAKIVTAVCALMELAVVILFGFLFVYRQRETSETMLMLGSGRVRVCQYFLYSSGLIALIAAISGAIVGYYLHGGIISLIAKAADRYSLIDSRFSNANLSISRSLEFAPNLKLSLFMLVGIVVFLLAVISCLGFAISTFIHNRPSQRKLWGPKKERKTSHLNGGSVKYALLSIFRGGERSLVVPILAVTVVFFFGQLANTALRYQKQLDTIYENTTIEGYYTDINGKQVGNLLLEGFNTASLYRSGMVDSLSISFGLPYYYRGVVILADGTRQDIPPLYVPPSYYALESLEAAILRGPDLTMTNDIRNSPEFFYSDTVSMNFLDGYDESFLTTPYDENNSYKCMVSSSLLKENGLSLGDTVRVAVDWTYTNLEYNRRVFYEYDLQVIGSYEKQGAEDVIYAPLSLYLNYSKTPSLIWDEGKALAGAPTETFDSGYQFGDLQKYVLQQFTFSSANFKLGDAHRLTELKEYLDEYGYSQVQDVSSIREFIVLKDAAFNNAVASIKQQIRYINTLYPFLYGLVGIIALVVSYLLVVSRKKEFATMRGLGATRTDSFFSFFFEQSILCTFGTMIGVVLWSVAMGEPTIKHWILIAGFLVCYFIGSSISIFIMNRTKVLTILSDKD